MPGPVINPAQCPPYATPLTIPGPGGGPDILNPAWYRFWANQSITQTQVGITIVTAANFPTLNNKVPAGFFYVSDYFHMLYWDGSVLTFADGGSNYYTFGDKNPSTGLQTAGGGWHPMDGSASVSYLTITTSPPGISIQTRSLQNLVSTAAYLKAGAGSSTLNPAVAPTFTGTPVTPAGTNSTPTLTMNSYTPAGGNSSPTFAGNSVALTAAGTFASTGADTAITSVGGSVTSFTPTGTITPPLFTGTPATLTGTVSAPIFTGTPLTPAGTISSTGEPESLLSRLWFRI